MHVKWLLLLTTLLLPQMYHSAGLSSSCYNFSEEIDWDIPLHHFMIPKCALYIQEQVLRESERQLVVVYAYMQILPLPPFKSLNRIYTHIFCCDCSHPETKPKATYIKLGVIAFRQHKWREGKKHKILRNFDRRGWKWYICLLPPVPYLFLLLILCNAIRLFCAWCYVASK